MTRCCALAASRHRCWRHRSRDCGAQFAADAGRQRATCSRKLSTAWSAGLVFQPTASLLMSVDYWNYVVDDSIGNIGEEVIFADDVKYANRIVRCSECPRTRAATIDNCQLPGRRPDRLHRQHHDQSRHLQDQRPRLRHGVAQSSRRHTGAFSLGWQATYVLQYEYQLEAGGAYQNNLGTFFNLQAISRYRQVLNLGWQQDVWAANLINRYRAATKTRTSSRPCLLQPRRRRSTPGIWR